MTEIQTVVLVVYEVMQIKAGGRGGGLHWNDEPCDVTAGIYGIVCDDVPSLQFDSCATALVCSLKLMTPPKVKKTNFCSCLRDELLTQVLFVSFFPFAHFRKTVGTDHSSYH